MLILSLCILITGISCQKNHATLFDDDFVTVAELQDKRATSALIPYLKHKEVTVRLHAAIAFSSIQDSTAVQALSDVLLNDHDVDVRIAAAYALGQTNAHLSFVALQKALEAEKNDEVIQTMYSALGKNAKTIHDLLPYQDSIPSTTWLNYFAGNRKVISPLATEHILTDWQNLSDHARLGAAHFLARGAILEAKHFHQVENIILKEENPEVRMGVVSSLRKIPSDSSFNLLAKIATTDSDYRVRVNAIYALLSFDFSKTKKALLQALSDPQPNVATAAGEVIGAKATKADVKELEENIEGKPFRIQGDLYEAIYRESYDDRIQKIIIEKFNQATSPYAKAAYLKALQHGFHTHQFLHQVLINADTPVVRITAAMGLINIQKQKDFPKELYSTFDSIVKDAMQLDDPAVIGLFAELLLDTSLNFKDRFTDYTFLKEARTKLFLPKDMEAIQPLEKAIHLFEGTPYIEPKNEFNHPINWDLLQVETKNHVRIKTTKGDIVILLLPKEAPGSVANFVALTKANYFNHKFFHRVVPNFVIQAGCNRGDGWGSEDYSIRSEFSGRPYKEGSVGMASAGKDTEGTQWFITHSLTPHLEGRYTIFAEVVSGMDVVHRIEVGDQIINASLE